jgi:hypothetical protein
LASARRQVWKEEKWRLGTGPFVLLLHSHHPPLYLVNDTNPTRPPYNSFLALLLAAALTLLKLEADLAATDEADEALLLATE